MSTKVITRLNPPYDTGRVKIGLTYFPVQRHVPDGDMSRLQTALLTLAPGPRSLANVSPLEGVVVRFRGLVRAVRGLP